MRKRRIIWYLMWFLSLLWISLKGGTIAFGVFFFMSAIPVVSYLYLISLLWQFRVYQHIATRVVTAKDATDYYFVLKNEGYVTASSIRVKLFQDFSYVEKLPDKAEFELLPGEEYKYETKLICKYRGTYKVGVESLILTDYLRLFSLHYKLPGTLEAIVSPRVPGEEEYKEEVQNLWLEQENRNLKTEPDAQIREYIPGDNRKLIHWKKSASMGMPQTRLLTGEQENEVCVFLDTYRRERRMEQYLPTENMLLEWTIALVSQLLLGGKPVVFVCRQGQSCTVEQMLLHDHRDFDAFMVRISAIDFDSIAKRSEIDAVEEILSQSALMKKVMLVSHTVSEKSAAYLNEIWESGLDCKLCMVDGETPANCMDSIPLLIKQSKEEMYG